MECGVAEDEIGAALLSEAELSFERRYCCWFVKGAGWADWVISIVILRLVARGRECSRLRVSRDIIAGVSPDWGLLREGLARDGQLLADGLWGVESRRCARGKEVLRCDL